MEANASETDVFPEKDKESAQGEEAPETYKEAVKDPAWRESMINEIRALRNRGCWRVVRTPQGARLIKSKYVYKLKQDWLGKVTKRKSRLVVQGFLQRERSRVWRDLCMSGKNSNISLDVGPD